MAPCQSSLLHSSYPRRATLITYYTSMQTRLLINTDIYASFICSKWSGFLDKKRTRQLPYDITFILLVVELALLVPTLVLLLRGSREEKGRSLLMEHITSTAKMLSRQEYFNAVESAIRSAVSTWIDNRFCAEDRRTGRITSKNSKSYRAYGRKRGPGES